MTAESEREERYWRAHPVKAFAVRSVVFIVPLLVSIATGLVVSRLLPDPQTTWQLIGWWVVVLAASTAAVYLADRQARRLLPLAALLQLSMLFPDRAPSRLKVARRISGSRAIAHELEHASHHGVSGTRQEAAETILALVGALGDYDSRTRGHSERTQLFVTMLADELNLNAEDKGRLMWAALIHDIGKLHVPHEILNKPSAPTEQEWHVLHSHPMQGAKICEPLREWLGEWWYAIEQHHEKWDGSGYPRGLAGTEISYGARIVTVADSYEVMTASRPYKRPMTAAAARQELIDCAGAHFDPYVVRAFLNISLGRTTRFTGPLALLAQFALVRPGPMLGQVFGASTGAAATAASVAALSLGPAALADAGSSHHVPSPGDGRHSSSQAASPDAPAAEPTSTAPTGDDSESAPHSGSPNPSPGSSGPTTTPGHPTGDGPTGPAPTGGSGPTTPAPTGDPDPTTPDPTTPDPTTQDPAPMTLNDDTLVLREDDHRNLDVFDNDSTTDGDEPELIGVTKPLHGAIRWDDNGNVEYEPDADFAGSDSFEYTATHHGATASATVHVTVTNVNDKPMARDDAVTTKEDTPVTLRLLANDADVDGDDLTITSVSGARHGTVTTDGTLTYTPDADFNGTDKLKYKISDGHGETSEADVEIAIASVNDAPVAADETYDATTANLLSVDAPGLLKHARDADGDTLAVTGDNSAAVEIKEDGSFTFLPVLPGKVVVRFIVSDGKARSTGKLTIHVTLLRTAPAWASTLLRPIV